ncbi:unnamed protein product, partial [Didymodactylos carnosus]
IIENKHVQKCSWKCEHLKTADGELLKKIELLKEKLKIINVTMNELEDERKLTWADFDRLLEENEMPYDDYLLVLRVVHKRSTMLYKRAPNARWSNQYNEGMSRAWKVNIDIQFILDPYGCAKYLASYTTKPEREINYLKRSSRK